MPERRVVALIAAVLVVCVAAALFFLSGGDDDEPVDPPGLAGAGVVAGNAAEYFDDGSDVLLYKSGTTLIERPVDGDERRLGGIDAGGVFPSPGSPWLAFYATATKKGPEKTVLTFLQTETEDEVELPNALGPVWSPDGKQLAFLEPENPDRCRSLARCGSKHRVYTWSPDAAGEEPVEISEPGDWTILGWSGSTVLVAEGGEGATAITAVAPDGGDEELDLAPHDLLAPSPDGRWLLVRAEGGGATLLSTGSAGDVEVELPSFDLTDAVWTHDSESVVAIAYPQAAADEPKKNKKGKRKRAELAQLVTFSPGDPFPQFFEESYGVFGDVMWGPGNDYVGFGRRLGGTLPEFVYCPVGEGDCISLIAYGEGTFPLRLQ